MMPSVAPGWHLLALALTLTGFLALALTREREGELLLGRHPTARDRRAGHLFGWPLLAASLLVCLHRWDGRFGIVLWFGWLTAAGVTLVFALPYRARRQNRPGRAKPPTPAAEPAAPRTVSRNLWRGLRLALLPCLPLGFAWALLQLPVHPLLRDDALRGQIGPWSFVLAEEERAVPEATPLGVPVKHFVLRFCDDCDAQIRAAYLKLRPPAPPLALGNAFQGEPWDRLAVVPIPAGATPEDRLWLTVIGTDGSEHRLALDIARLSPETARFLQENSR